MPIPRVVHNAFTAREMHAITGLSMPMINYLRRMDFLTPAYNRGPGTQGKVRYYSYRDLVAAKLVQKLREAGVELKTIKIAIARLRSDKLWEGAGDDVPSNLRWLKTDGTDVFVERTDGFLEHMRSDGQGAFGFLVNVSTLAAEVRARIPKGVKRTNFSMQNHALAYPQKKTGR